MHGWGVPQDGNAAFQSFTHAADEGVLEAHSGLAQCFTDGIGTTKDLERAKYDFLFYFVFFLDNIKSYSIKGNIG